MQHNVMVVIEGLVLRIHEINERERERERVRARVRVSESEIKLYCRGKRTSLFEELNVISVSISPYRPQEQFA